MWKRALHAGLDLYFASILPSALNILRISRTMTSLIERTIAEQAVEVHFVRVVAGKIFALRITEIRKALVSPLDVWRGLFLYHCSNPPDKIVLLYA